MAVDLSVEYRDVVFAAAKAAGVPPELLIELLDLESKHTNLHAWGARPALRREIADIMERALGEAQR